MSVECSRVDALRCRSGPPGLRSRLAPPVCAHSRGHLVHRGACPTPRAPPICCTFDIAFVRLREGWEWRYHGPASRLADSAAGRGEALLRPRGQHCVVPRTTMARTAQGPCHLASWPKGFRARFEQAIGYLPQRGSLTHDSVSWLCAVALSLLWTLVSPRQPP